MTDECVRGVMTDECVWGVMTDECFSVYGGGEVMSVLGYEQLDLRRGPARAAVAGPSGRL